jgi:hypothetical protein
MRPSRRTNQGLTPLTKIEASSKTATKLGQISDPKTTSVTTLEISSKEDRIQEIIPIGTK